MAVPVDLAVLVPGRFMDAAVVALAAKTAHAAVLAEGLDWCALKCQKNPARPLGNIMRLISRRVEPLEPVINGPNTLETYHIFPR